MYVGTDGLLHKVKDGADTVLPFSSNKSYTLTVRTSSSLYVNGSKYCDTLMDVKFVIENGSVTSTSTIQNLSGNGPSGYVVKPNYISITKIE